ncbi:MAG: negative regulator for alginate biosynthesis [Gammaproteobacteria bacterium]|nr:MAG: negative regulator for alginate biosynthesis [Gammaproteobacteria bacterium]
MLQNLLRYRCSHVLLAALSLITTGVASAAVCPGADAAALSWLDKMSRSVRQVSYNGVVTLQRGDDMQVMQISHSVGEGTISERLTELTGQGAQVERADHPLDCIHPGHRLLRLGADLQAGRCGIAQYYRFSVTDGERVAGRMAVRIRIEPRDMYRFGYVMQLDGETALLLKAETIGRGEKILEKFQFANLSYSGQILDGTEVNLVHEAQHPLPPAAVPTASDGNKWGVGWVPRGFISTDIPVGGGGRRTYTDGLAVFSVFLEELGQEIRPGEGVVHRGSTLSYTRGMRFTGQSVLVTVIGEVPVNTARMVADSVDWTP